MEWASFLCENGPFHSSLGEMARKVTKHHYVASVPREPVFVHRGYSTDGEESQRGAASDRTVSEYVSINERRPPPRPPNRKNKYRPPPPPSDVEGSEIYVTSAAYRAPSEIRLDSSLETRINLSRHAVGQLRKWNKLATPCCWETRKSLSRHAVGQIRSLNKPVTLCCWAT
uniref:(California timema) hypothetical protein n=1 Tax=Timema californicum TaxID=61474 RepID=A0A7R9P6X2_TIMCA|nr:unnamed protein product [Timema californicum]